MRCTQFAIAFSLLLPCIVQGSTPVIVIHAGSLLVDPAKPPLMSATVVIRDGIIESVQEGYVDRTVAESNGPVAQIVDLRSAFVLPGLIDLHVHLTTPAEPGGDLRTVTESSADLALMALVNGERNLAAGFTTVVDLGTGRRDHEEAIFALRAAVEQARAVGPRIIAAGSPLSPTGASRTGRYRPEIDAANPPQGVCDGADDCRRSVREQVARGADIINVYNSGSLNDEHIALQTFTDAEFEAIVETAHALERLVIADGHTAAGINAALRAGADIVDTAPWPDDTSWRLMRETGAAFVPHLFAFEEVVGETLDSLAQGSMHWIPEPIMQRLYRIKNEPYSAERAYREGITLVFGSDTGVIPHGANAGEFAELVGIGLQPAEAIASATSEAARVLRMADKIGTLEPGKAADLIAVAGNPLQDIRELERVGFVMKGGLVIRNDLTMAR